MLKCLNGLLCPSARERPGRRTAASPTVVSGGPPRTRTESAVPRHRGAPRSAVPGRPELLISGKKVCARGEGRPRGPRGMGRRAGGAPRQEARARPGAQRPAPRPLPPAGVRGAAPWVPWGGAQAPPTPPPPGGFSGFELHSPEQTPPRAGRRGRRGGLGLTAGEGGPPGAWGAPLCLRSGFASVHQGGFSTEQLLSSRCLLPFSNRPLPCRERERAIFSPVALTYLQQKPHKRLGAGESVGCSLSYLPHRFLQMSLSFPGRPTTLFKSTTLLPHTSQSGSLL